MSFVQGVRKRWLLLLAMAMVWAPMSAEAQSADGPSRPPAGTTPGSQLPAPPVVAPANDAGAATAAGAAIDAGAASAATPECAADPDRPSCPTPLSRSLSAVEAYVTAPARWNGRDWLLFGGALAAVSVAHSFDTSVRTHFADGSRVSVSNGSPNSVSDALPAAALFLGTWGFAKLTDNEDGRREAHAMVEAGALSVASAYAIGYVARREAPNQTTHPNRWESSGTSFPSEHTTLAFAIGTVLAESGNDHYRWVRRVLGYGAAGYTSYERLHHNAHWLSDTVAGAALGAASARFAMNRRRAAQSQGELALQPIPRGVMITYAIHLP